MFAGNLSRYLPGPPSPQMQQINAIIHQEPYSTIVYVVYWSIFLMTLPPIAGITLMWVLIYEMILYSLGPSRLPSWLQRQKIEPKKLLSLEEGEETTKTELAVLITGCDSGFGKELALRLASEKGFVVFAGCLNEESTKKEFAGEKLIQPIIMDVTNQKHIDNAYEKVQNWLNGTTGNSGKTTTRYFHALINNAGIGRMGFVDWCTMSSYELCMDVNCFAQIRTTKTFLPIFKKQAIDNQYEYNPQIVNMNSMAGSTSGGGFGLSPYEVSKNAAESFTDGLRLEMKTWGVKVVSVNPSFHKTPMGDYTTIKERAKKESWDPLPQHLKDEYGKDFFDTYVNHISDCIKAGNWDMKVVIDSMVECIESNNPPAQLAIGMDAKFAIMPMRMLPQWCRHYCIQLLQPKLIPAALVPQKREKQNYPNQ